MAVKQQLQKNQANKHQNRTETVHKEDRGEAQTMSTSPDTFALEKSLKRMFAMGIWSMITSSKWPQQVSITRATSKLLIHAQKILSCPNSDIGSQSPYTRTVSADQRTGKKKINSTSKQKERRQNSSRTMNLQLLCSSSILGCLLTSLHVLFCLPLVSFPLLFSSSFFLIFHLSLIPLCFFPLSPWVSSKHLRGS